MLILWFICGASRPPLLAASPLLAGCAVRWRLLTRFGEISVSVEARRSVIPLLLVLTVRPLIRVFGCEVCVGKMSFALVMFLRCLVLWL